MMLDILINAVEWCKVVNVELVLSNDWCMVAGENVWKLVGHRQELG